MAGLSIAAVRIRLRYYLEAIITLIGMRRPGDEIHIISIPVS